MPDAAVTLSPERIRALARECGFQLAGVAPAAPLPDAARYLDWAARGLGGEMRYLTDHRAALRADPRSLLETAKSVICLGRLYRTAPERAATPETGWISRYAWGDDYHDLMRRDMEALAARLLDAAGPFDYRVCVDTVPILERSYARRAGLGWIGRNTCLIHEGMGSWFFLGEILTSLDLEPGAPPPDRCGTCTRCVDACPTAALVPAPVPPASGARARGLDYELDATRCISYFTIELRGAVPEPMRAAVGTHVFGCDICQDVCPWNRRAPLAPEAEFAPRSAPVALDNPPLDRLAALSPEQFRGAFRGSPVLRARYTGLLRNVALAMGNSGNTVFRPALEKLSESEREPVAEAARWALRRLD